MSLSKICQRDKIAHSPLHGGICRWLSGPSDTFGVNKNLYLFEGLLKP